MARLLSSCAFENGCRWPMRGRCPAGSRTTRGSRRRDCAFQRRETLNADRNADVAAAAVRCNRSESSDGGDPSYGFACHGRRGRLPGAARFPSMARRCPLFVGPCASCREPSSLCESRRRSANDDKTTARTYMIDAGTTSKSIGFRRQTFMPLSRKDGLPFTAFVYRRVARGSSGRSRFPCGCAGSRLTHVSDYFLGKMELLCELNR
jgi:hypothetical protein